MPDESPRRLDALLTPATVVALLLLLLNDFVLKPRFGTPLTGKLSDFAGLYLFAAFWLAVLPRRRPVVLGVAAAWLVWKTPISTPLIEGWNALGLLPVARVADATDLVALLVLLPLFRSAPPRPTRPPFRRLAGPAMAAPI
jgi:hypothetical protein